MANMVGSTELEPDPDEEPFHSSLIRQLCNPRLPEWI
jgi:hypothetical protein